MKRLFLRALISEIIEIMESDDATKDIERAKNTVADKLKNNKELSPEESELAVSSTDKDDRTKLSQSISSTVK